MIEFEKVQDVPTDVNPGEDRIWFSLKSGSIFVADNQGHPIRMSSGSIEGASVPVGTPAVSNILYHCTSNGKTYISTPTEWKELNSASQPGSGGSVGGAGSIIINDPGNWYTSSDVEGALYEIGANLPQFFGKRELQQYNGNVYDWDEAGEREATATATNKPSTVPAWVNQRKAADGTVYGISVDKEGKLFSRIGDKWIRQVSYNDLDDLGLGLNEDIGALGNKKVIAGDGLIGGGAIKDNPTLSLDPEKLTYLLQTTPLPFLRTSGGFVTGEVQLRNPNSLLTLTGVANGSENIATPLSLYNNGDTRSAGFKDTSRGTNLLKFNMTDGSFSMDTRREGKGGSIKGALRIEDIGQSVASVLEVVGPSAKKIAKFTTDKGIIQFDTTDAYNYIESGNPLGKIKDLKISGPDNTQLQEIRFLTDVAYSTGRFMSADGVTVGKNIDGYGTVNHSNKLYLYPYKIDPSMNYNTARRFYTHLGYNQDSRTLEIRTFVKDNTVHYTDYIQKDINVSATKFLSRSSEQFKNVHQKFSEKYDPIEILRNVDSWLYDFKEDDSHKENAGFIIERGVPEFAIENKGTTIDSYSMVAVLWEAVKRLDQEVEKLKSQK